MSLTIISAENPVYSQTDKKGIHLTVQFKEINGKIEFNAKIDDSEKHGVELYNNAITGEYGEVADFVEPTKPPMPTEPPFIAPPESQK